MEAKTLVALRVSNTTLEKIKARATANGESVSEFIRRAISVQLFNEKKVK